MKDIFLKALEMGWRAKKLSGDKEVDKDRLLENVRLTLDRLGDTIISDNDVREIIDRVWN